MKLKYSKLSLAGLSGLTLALTGSSLSAADFVWDGTTNLWNSLHWNPGLVAGPTTSGNTATINGGQVTFAGNDTFGNATITTSPGINLNAGGTLASSNNFNAIVNLNINGGTLLSNGGVNSPYGAFALKGTVTVGGSTASNFTTGTGSFNTISVGAGAGGGTTTFNVADVTGNSSADLLVGTVLNNLQNVASGIIKTGAGTMQLSATNTYTGTTTVSAGTLSIASTGALSSAGNVNTTGGGLLDISGTLTMAANTYFAIGNGIASTTGTTILNTGANVNLGGNAVLIGGNRPVSGTGTGTGTLTINGGTLTVAAASGTGGGADNTRIWLNPYSTVGTSTLNLNGGLLSTARDIWDGGGNNSRINFDGGTLRAGANSTTFVQVTTANVRNGGAIIDTQNFNVTVASALAHSNIGGDNTIDGGLTKNGIGTLTLSAANTYSGATAIKNGTLTLGVGNDRLPTGTTVTLGDGVTNTNGILKLDSRSQQLAGLLTAGSGTGNRVVNDNATAATLTLSFASGTNTFGGILGGTTANENNFALTKSGNGILALSGTNSYTGATAVNGGTLIVNGNISTSTLTTVQTGATLGGSGTVGDLTIDSGGFFSPGNSPGITTVDGNYIQNGQLNMEITGLTAGTQHDQVNVINGTVTLAGLLYISSFTGSYALNNLLFILLNDSTDAITGTFTGLAQGATVGTYAGFDWQISYTGNSVGSSFTGGNDVVLMAIPEPRAALLGGLGLLALLRRRRQ